MKKILLILSLVALTAINAQFKADLDRKVDIKSGILNKDSASPFGFLGIEGFKMNHSFSLSYSGFGGGGMALGTYTNSMFFQFNDRLNIQADVSIMNSPYNSFGNDFAKQINGIYLSRLQMNYKISENMNVHINYQNSPFGYYSPYYNEFSPFSRNSYFDRW